MDIVLANVLLAACWFCFLFSFPFSKISPKKVGPLYLLYPLLIASGGELTLFTFPFLIASPHYSTKLVWYNGWQHSEPDGNLIDLRKPEHVSDFTYALKTYPGDQISSWIVWIGVDPLAKVIYNICNLTVVCETVQHQRNHPVSSPSDARNQDWAATFGMLPASI